MGISFWGKTRFGVEGEFDMTDLIVIAVVLIILGLASGYIVRAKRCGVKCIGCPSGKTCGKSGCCCNHLSE